MEKLTPATIMVYYIKNWTMRRDEQQSGNKIKY